MALRSDIVQVETFANTTACRGGGQPCLRIDNPPKGQWHSPLGVNEMRSRKKTGREWVESQPSLAMLYYLGVLVALEDLSSPYETMSS